MEIESSRYHFSPMTSEQADKIAYKWKYKGKYSFYNITKDKKELEIFLDEKLRKSHYYTVYEENKIILGFFSYTFENNVMWIGLGLHPQYTGKGYGLNLIQAGIAYGIEEYNYQEDKILLSVAEFNKRAIKLYEKLNFQFIVKQDHLINGKLYPHFIMGKKIK